MNEDLSLDVTFLINNPEVAKAAAEVKKEILGVDQTADEVARKSALKMKTLFSDSAAEVEAYRKSVESIGGTVAKSGLEQLIKEVNEDFKTGKIDVKAYREEVERLNSIKNQSVSTPATNSTPQYKLGYEGIFDDGEAALAKLDKEAQKSILALANIKGELLEVAAAQKQLSEAFDGGTIKAATFDQGQATLLARENELQGSLKGVTNDLKAAGSSTSSLYKELNITKGAMAQLALAGKANSAEYLELSNRSGELQNNITAINQSVKQLGSNTVALDTGIAAVEGLAGAFATGQGVVALFGQENGNLEKVIVKITSAMAILQGVQSLSNSLTKLSALASVFLSSARQGEAAATASATAATAGNTVAVATNTSFIGAAIAATRTWTAALLANPIGLIAAAITLAATALVQYINSTDSAADSVERLNNQLEFQNELLNDNLSAIELGTDYALALAKKRNASESEMQTIRNQGLEKQLKTLQEEKQALGNSIDENDKAFAEKKKSEEQYYKDADSIRAKYKANGTAVLNTRARLDIGSIEYDVALNKEEKDAEKERARLAKEATRRNTERANEAMLAYKRQQSLIAKIDDIENKASQRALTRDEAEIKSIRDKYAAINKEIEQFVKNPKNKGYKINTAGLKTSEKNEVDAATQAQEVEALKIGIDKQKQLFDQFEEYKINFSSQKATERYGKDLQGFKTYIDYLKSLLPEGSDQSTKANALRDLLNKDLIPKAEKDASNKAFDENAKNLRRILEATKTAKNEEFRINEQYDKDLATARINLHGQELAERESALANNRKLALEGVRQMAFQETEIAQQMSKDLFFLTEKELKAHLLKLKASLKGDRLLDISDPAKLTPAQLKALKEAKSNAEDLTKESNETAENFKTTSDILGQISGSFNDLANALGDTNPGLADTLATLGQISQVGSDAAGSVASFMTGDIVGGITKGIKAIAGIINIFKAAKESAKQARSEVEKFYETARQGETEYQAMLRERARQQAADNASNLKGLKAQYELLKLQNSDVNTQASVLLRQLQKQQYISGQHTEKYGGFLGIGRKTKVVDDFDSLNGKSYEDLEQLFTQGKLTEGAAALFEQLKKLKEEGADVTATLRDLGDQLNEIFTGTTSDSLVDSIKQMFKEGKTSAQDFADFFKDSMSDAALSIFEDKVLRDLISTYYDKFAESAKSDDMLTEAEIVELQKLFSSLTTTASNMFEDLKKVTGIDFDNPDDTPDKNPNNLSGAIRTASQESIDLLAGQTGGMRIAQLEGNAIARTNSLSIQEQNNQLAVQHLTLLKIEVNTKVTADTISSVDKSLKSIDGKMNGNVLAANGKG